MYIFICIIVFLKSKGRKRTFLKLTKIDGTKTTLLLACGEMGDASEAEGETKGEDHGSVMSQRRRAGGTRSA